MRHSSGDGLRRLWQARQAKLSTPQRSPSSQPRRWRSRGRRSCSWRRRSSWRRRTRAAGSKRAVLLRPTGIAARASPCEASPQGPPWPRATRKRRGGGGGGGGSAAPHDVSSILLTRGRSLLEGAHAKVTGYHFATSSARRAPAVCKIFRPSRQLWRRLPSLGVWLPQLLERLRWWCHVRQARVSVVFVPSSPVKQHVPRISGGVHWGVSELVSAVLLRRWNCRWC